MTQLVNGLFGPERRCEPGETELPTDCERHPEHYWCATCVGYYGVPHDGRMHTGRFAHPNQHAAGFENCACRVCTNLRAELDVRRGRR